MLFLVREGMVEGRCIKDSASARTLIGFVDFSCGGNELQRARATEKSRMWLNAAVAGACKLKSSDQKFDCRRPIA